MVWSEEWRCFGRLVSKKERDRNGEHVLEQADIGTIYWPCQCCVVRLNYVFLFCNCELSHKSSVLCNVYSSTSAEGNISRHVFSNILRPAMFLAGHCWSWTIWISNNRMSCNHALSDYLVGFRKKVVPTNVSIFVSPSVYCVSVPVFEILSSPK